jgi:hypothetical protein
MNSSWKISARGVSAPFGVIGVRSIFVVKADPKIYGRKLTCIDLTPVPVLDRIWATALLPPPSPRPLYVASRVLFFDSSCCLWAICAPQGDVGNRECGCPRPRRGCPRASLFSPVDRQIVHRLAPGHCARSFRFWCRSSSGPWVFEPVGERRARHRFVRSCSPNGCPGPGLPLEPEFARRGT